MQVPESLQEWTQSAIAVLIVVAAIVTEIASVYRNSAAVQLPGWEEIGLGTVIGYYFGKAAVGYGISKATNGMSDMAVKVAGQVHQETEATAARIALEQVKEEK